MKAIDTSALAPDQLSHMEMLQVYNGLDCCVTLEVLHETAPQLDEATSLIYKFERAMQAPALEMSLRGMLIDQEERGKAITTLSRKLNRVNDILTKLALVVWGQPLNYNSPTQLKEFFYVRLGLPEVIISQKGEKKVSTNREALEKLEPYIFARPFVNCILAARDLSKKLSVLHSGVDSDGRMRASYNVCGTETGRWSSSENAFGTGTNLQNITDELRQIFIADAGMKFAYIDLEQAESRAVAALLYFFFRDTRYLDACESGDLHTTVSQMVWPGLPWTEDKKANRAIADQIFYRHFSYRDMAKRGGHGTNYYGTPFTMARNLKVEQKLMETFQAKYKEAFPLRQWHEWVARNLQLHGCMTTYFGRRRFFLGRREDDSTLREAIAYEPQSMIGDMLNLGLWRLWYYGPREIQMLAQIHDAILIQYPEEREEELLPIALSLVHTPFTVHDREIKIETEALTGWNWRKFDNDSNRDGLKKWKGSDDRRRLGKAVIPMLDRRIY